MPSPSPAEESRQSTARVGASQGPVHNAPPSADSTSEPEEDELAVKQLGEFRLLRPLGRGGMSEVFLAEQTSLHRQVAIKVLRKELLSDGTILKRFEQEAKAAAGLIHPNIVQVYSFGAQDGIHFIAQEYVQGLNLRQFLNKKGPPDLLLACHIMRQVSAALSAAGDAGIVHRDIKPENILVTRKGEAKVADFGLAQLAESEQRVQLTQVGMTMGTPLYMSPEQINGETVDHRSDIYSFGVTCYRMLSGRPPFRGETTLTLAMQHLTQKPEPLSTLRSDLPPVLCDIVHKMMARDPAKRYQHAREITQDLKQAARVLKDEPATAGATKPSKNALQQHGSWREAFFAWPWARHGMVLAGVGLLIAALSAGIGWELRPKDPFSAALAAQDRTLKPTVLGSAKQQFEQASQLQSDEEAWRAVIENFPDDRVYTPQAKEKLAILYLKSRRPRLEEAKELFAELEAMGREDATAKAVGVAGKAIISSLQGRYLESQRLIVYELGDLRNRREQIPTELWFLLQQAGAKNAPHLDDEQANKQVKELFEDEP